MIPFRFRLQRVLDLRRTQFQIAESECHQVEKRLRTAEAQHAALSSHKSETRASVTRLPEVMGRTLAPLTDWFHWTEIEDQRFRKLEKALATELEKRRALLVEAHRRVRLLEKMREKQYAEWLRASERETEQIAGDSINSRYARSTMDF